MTARLPALRTSRAPFPRNVCYSCPWYSFLLEARIIAGPRAAGTLQELIKLHLPLPGLLKTEHVTPQTWACNCRAMWLLRWVNRMACVWETSGYIIDQDICPFRKCWHYVSGHNRTYPCSKGLGKLLLIILFPRPAVTIR
jgi:hypothetical protein